jgi:hypothetical protein
MRHGEGKKAVRKVFSDVKYYDDELEKLKEFEEMIIREEVHLPSNWTQVETIKYMYSGKFELKKSLKNLKEHLEWRAIHEQSTLSPSAYKYLEDGILYISGRDKQYRPIIIINVYKLNPKQMDLADFIAALCFVLDTCKKFYFVPGKVENWVIIIESNSMGVFNFPFKIVKTINDVTSVNYTSTLDRLYIMNPSTFLNSSWNIISSFIDPETSAKISMLKKSHFKQLLERISVDQLEERYDGKLPSRKVYWPPINTLNEPPYTIELKMSAPHKNEDAKVHDLETKITDGTRGDIHAIKNKHSAEEERANTPAKSDNTPNSGQKTAHSKANEDFSSSKKHEIRIENNREQEKEEHNGLHQAEDEGNKEEELEVGGQALFEDKDKKIRNVNSKLEEHGSESLRESHQERGENPNLNHKSKKPRVSFVGELNDSSEKKGEPQILLEGHGTKVEFCGFCGPSNKKSTDSCAIF